MGWGNGIGIGWPNASASAGPPPVPVWYLFDTGLCGWVLPTARQTGPLLSNQYAEGDFVLIPSYEQRARLVSPSLTPHIGVDPINTTGKYTDCGL
jgi:hypothetical protein